MSQIFLLNEIVNNGITVNHQRPATNRNQMGQKKLTYSTENASVKAWISPISTNETERWGRRGIEVDHKVFITTDISAVIGDRFEYGSRYLIIEGVENPAEKSMFWKFFTREEND